MWTAPKDFLTLNVRAYILKQNLVFPYSYHWFKPWSLESHSHLLEICCHLLFFVGFTGMLNNHNSLNGTRKPYT